MALDLLKADFEFHKLRSVDGENDLRIITKEACKFWHILK